MILKKTKEYTDALKNSINDVNSKLPEFSEGLQPGLKAIGEKLPEVVDALVKLNAPGWHTRAACVPNEV